MTFLMALSTIASEQTKASEKTLEKCTQLLDYLALHLDKKIDITLWTWQWTFTPMPHICQKQMHAAVHAVIFSWDRFLQTTNQLNWTEHFTLILPTLQFVVASAAEAEPGALFHNCQTGIIFCSILEDLGHHQPKMPVHCDNTTAVGITNNSVKHRQSCLMEMHFFWISGKVAQNMYSLAWHPGQENLADYQSKHHMGCHHVAFRPWYLHMENSPCFLPWTQTPSALKGCVGTLDDGYLRKVPLPWAPRIQSPGHVTCAAVMERDKRDTCYLQVPCVPTWSDLVRSHAGLARSMMLQLMDYISGWSYLPMKNLGSKKLGTLPR